jgi:hypothetical protein
VLALFNLIMEKEIKKTGIEGLLSDSHRYKTEKGEISMLPPCSPTFNSYEIYCWEGGLFDGIERYDTLEEAEERINELLN